MWLLHAISLPVQIPDFYAKSRSLYADVSMLHSKWSSFFFTPLLWVHNLELRPVRPSAVGVGVANLYGGGGLKCVNFRRCAWCTFFSKNLLRQSQSRARCPLRFPGSQGTWISSSMEYPGLRPHNHNFNLAITPVCKVQNGFIRFCVHESTQSGN